MATRVADLRNHQPLPGIDVADDKALVIAFQSGDTAAYADIFLKYRALASQICFRILQDREEADEAVQETMLRVYRGLPVFNGRYQLQAWIARIATNVSLDMIRARQRRPQRGLAIHDISEEQHADVIAIGEDASEALDRVLEQQQVRSILSEIPDHHREALVLREFEGRSHEEIADALGVSPQQAKALIHRAKKSFRRAWDDGERRGIAAFAPILLAPIRLPGILRRLVASAHDAAVGAAATAQQAAVQVSASPAVVQTTMSVGDKVTAAALTVIVAGTVGVGAVAIKHAAAPTKPAPVASSPAPAPSVPSTVVAVPPVKAKPAAKPAHHKAHHHHHAVQPGDQGSPSDTPSGSPAPSTDPSSSPAPDGSVTPPAPLPAPAWSGSFGASVGLTAAHLTQTATHVTADGSLFEQTVQGAIVGPKGKELGAVYLDFGGSVGPTQGRLSSIWLWVDAPEGRYTYAVNGTLSGVNKAADGSTTYTFEGDYSLSGLPAALHTDVPHDGTIQIALRFWSDGTPIGTSVSMTDA